MSFGRKGLEAGQPQPMLPPMRRDMAATGEGSAPASAQLQAFLAQERAQRAREPVVEPGLTDVARRTRPVTATRDGGLLGERNLVVAYVFWWFCSPIAAHRFYLGAHGSALAMLGLFWGGLLAMLLSPALGLLGIGSWLLWTIADLFLIPGLMRRWQQTPVADVFA